MSEAVDNLHAIERLVALVDAGPRADVEALKEAHAVLSKMGLASGASGYKAEKLKAVSDAFDSWLGGQPQTASGDCGISRGRLIRDIDHLRKALARGAEGQD
jgi:hypothetical protein